MLLPTIQTITSIELSAYSLQYKYQTLDQNNNTTWLCPFFPKQAREFMYYTLIQFSLHLTMFNGCSTMFSTNFKPKPTVPWISLMVNSFAMGSSKVREHQASLLNFTCSIFFSPIVHIWHLEMTIQSISLSNSSMPSHTLFLRLPITFIQSTYILCICV